MDAPSIASFKSLKPTSAASPIRSPIWGVCSCGRSGTLQHGSDVKSKLFRDFGERLRDGRAVNKCPFGSTGIFHQAPENRRCCLIGSWLMLLFCSALRVFFKQARGESLWLNGRRDRVQVKKTFLFIFLFGFIVFSDSRADSHLGWTMTPLGLNGAGLPDLGANISDF